MWLPDRAYGLAIIGSGAMGQGLARGLIAADVHPPERIVVTDVDKDRLAAFSEKTGVHTAGNIEAVSRSDTIILAVKPKVVEDVLEEIAGYVVPDQVVISIAAAVKTQQIESMLKSGVPVIRAMPNLPCIVREGATAITRGRSAQDSHVERAVAIFGAVGKVLEVPEELIDTVTGLSGSGPAYVYMFIEALTEAGATAGLTRDQARLLAAQTVLGAGKMVLETNEHPARLKDTVANPGGTTLAGLAALERAAFRAAVLDAVQAAAERAKELFPD